MTQITKAALVTRVEALEKSLKGEAAERKRLEKALADSLEQQTATADILRVISSSPRDLQPVFDTIVRSAVRLCDGLFSGLYRFDGELIHQVAQYNYSPEALDAARRVLPTPPSRDFAVTRAILDRAIVHIPDVELDPEYRQVISRAAGVRSILAVPMLRDGSVSGAIAVGRAQPGPFSDKQLELLKTFADQAVIAIENVRLLKELESRNRELTEALEQQTATGEILRVISSSPTDLTPVLESIAGNAARLCEADDVSVIRAESNGITILFSVGPASAFRGQRFSTIQSATSQAIREGRTVHVPDLLADPHYEIRPEFQGFAWRSALAVPLLRDGVAIGTITARRSDARPFSEQQIKLLETFADQAVIAIENVRLFRELHARNRDLTEALEQQTATSEVLKVTSRSAFDLQPVLETLVENATRLCGADRGSIVRPDGDLYRVAVVYGASPEYKEFLERNPPRAGRGTVMGRVVLDRRTVHVEDVLQDPEYQWTEAQSVEGFRTVLGVPMLREDTLLGVFIIWRDEVGPFTDKQIELVRTFADQAVIAIENVRLFKELEARNRDLTEALEQQTATEDILRVISSSPTDAQPVFDTIAARAKRLCDARECAVFRFDGELIHLVAQADTSATWAPALRRAFPRPPGRGSVTARAIQTRSLVHIPDVLADPEFDMREAARVSSVRTVLSVPMIHEGKVIGAITVDRRDPKPFLDKQIGLVKIFADQAVIAIENVRLFKELEERNRALTQAHARVTEALEQQTATAEILRVISSSPTELQPVFERILQRAVALCGARHGSLFRFDGVLLHAVAHYNLPPATLEIITQEFPSPPHAGRLSGRTILSRQVVAIEDVLADESYESTAPHAGAFRSMLGVPLLRDGRPIGAIVIVRSDPGSFPEKQTALLQTFADQAVIAIENVRLFTELQEKNRALTQAHSQVSQALDRQTATAEVLRVIASSPTDEQPVFETIVRSALRLLDGHSAALRSLRGNELHLVAFTSTTPEGDAALARAPVVPVSAAGYYTQVVENRRPAVVEDTEMDSGFTPEARVVARARGYRSLLSVPLLRGESVLGLINVSRRAAGPFSGDAIALLQTFADQAVIAIENVRLFTELQARNRELTEALDRQTATAEILRVISQSQTKVQPVFDAISDNATRLFRAWAVAIFRVEGQIFRAVTARGGWPGSGELLSEHPGWPTDRETLAGQCMVDRAMIHVSDWSYPGLVEGSLLSASYRY